MSERILLSLCHMGGNELKYVTNAFDINWVVPLGPHVNAFEQCLADYLTDGHKKLEVVALSAGTAAIHLGLIMAGVKRDDEVICQSLTFSASANPVTYIGARPVFVDSEPDTYNMDPVRLEEAIIDRKRVTGRYPAAIVPVHLYGMPAKMDEIMAVADKYGIPVVEDSAEALGSEYRGYKCGTFGRYGVLSFNGNKIITTSGGGALICPDEEAKKRVLYYATQARENRPYYYHTEIGYNYRLSNICAAIGCGQMEVLPDRLERRRAIHALYLKHLDGYKGVKVQINPSDDFNSNFWLSTILLPADAEVSPDEVRQALDAQNIETRLIWRPMHMQPVYADAPMYGGSVSEDIFSRGLCLPSGSSLTDNDIMRVINGLKDAIK